MREHELCPTCGGDLVLREVETILRGGADTAVVRAQALVCSNCREQVYPIKLVREFERIRLQLSNGNTEDFRPLGRAYEVNLLNTA